MYKEELTEEGIVKASKDGIAEIIISDSNHCEECSAKIYCKPGNEKFRTLLAKDPFNSESGDKVIVKINGSRILKASIQLYGITLLILLIGIVVGMNLFNSNKELYSTILGITLSGIYLSIFSLTSKKTDYTSYPEIFQVKKPSKSF
ncbi:MAG: SoxR reducing system RseC family protein [Ignavibacterium sp.]|nr:SoxR reducing system RseC family protein [Ignavibacterium sp.]